MFMRLSRHCSTLLFELIVVLLTCALNSSNRQCIRADRYGSRNALISFFGASASRNDHKRRWSSSRMTTLRCSQFMWRLNRRSRTIRCSFGESVMIYLFKVHAKRAATLKAKTVWTYMSICLTTHGGVSRVPPRLLRKREALREIVRSQSFFKKKISFRYFIG